MASGHRKRKAAILRSYVLSGSGYTNVAEENRGDPAEQNSLMNSALYGFGGYDYANSSFTTDGSTTIISDALSNRDGIWTLLGYAGETSASGSGFIPGSTVHNLFSLLPGARAGSKSNSTTTIIYSGPDLDVNYNPYYLASTNRIVGTASIDFGTTISGAAAGNPKLKIYIAGALPTGAIGSVLTVTTGGASPLITYTSSSANIPLGSNGLPNFDAVTASFSTVFPTAISGNLPGAGDKISITLPVGYAGLTATASYTIQIITGSLVTPPDNTMYIVTGAAGVNLTGSTFHGILKSGINATTASNTSSFGTGFSNLYSYVSASSSTAGVSLFATQPSRYGYQIAVSGSNNKIKKVAGVSYFRYEPYYVEASFNTASMGNLIITYSSSASTATLNSFVPGIIIYITGSAT